MDIMNHLLKQIAKRRTFAIISHPDAGKTTITEKMLLLGNAIKTVGTVKEKKSGIHGQGGPLCANFLKEGCFPQEPT